MTSSNMRAVIFFFLATQLVMLKFVKAQLMGPVNTCVLVNEEAHLNCTWPADFEANNILQWSFTNSTSLYQIYQSSFADVFPDQSRDYGIQRINETREFNLIVKSVTFELAGTRIHTCQLIAGQQPQYQAYIVAVDNVACPDPGTIEEAEGTEVLVECIVRYASYQDKLRPLLNWTTTASGDEMTSYYHTNETYARSYMNLTLDSTYDGMNFTCGLSFGGGVPDYSDSCTTFIYVLYGVNNVSTVPAITETDVLTVGTVITCIGNGRPVPSFEWQDENNNTVGSGPELTVSADMVGKERLVFTCYATNNVSGVTYNQFMTISFTAIAAPGDVATNSVETWVIVVSVVVPVVVIAIAAVIIFIIFRRRRQKRKQKRQNGGSTAAAATIPMSVTATTSQQTTNSGENRPFLYSASTDPPAPVPVAAPRPLSADSNGAPIGMGYADLGRSTQSPIQPGVNGVDGRGPGSQYGGSLSRVNTPNPMTYPYQPSGRLTPGSVAGAGGRGTPGAMMTGPPSVAAYGATPGGGASRAGSTGRMTPGPGPGVDMRQNPYQQRPTSVDSASTVSHSGSSYHGSQHAGMPPALSLPPQRSMDAASHAGSLV